MNNTRVSNENLSSRTQDLLKNFSTKKLSKNENDSKVSYEELFAKISKDTEKRITNLKASMSDGVKAADASKKQWQPSIISNNVETKVYTGPITLDEKAAQKIAGETASSEPAALSFKYKKSIDELAAKHNINEKLKNRDIDAEISALISRKINGKSADQLAVRKDMSEVTEMYTVKKGDTLASIAKNFYDDAFKFKDIAVVNDMRAPYKLAEGQTLKVVFHQVKAAEGDTLDSISQKYTDGKVAPKVLAKINKTESFNSGDDILLPVQFTINTASAEKTAQTSAAETEAKPAAFKSAGRVDIAKMPENSQLSIETAKKQIEKYASQIERVNF